MQDFHEYEPTPAQPRRNGGVILAIIAVALVFSILGGITAVALTRGNNNQVSATMPPLLVADAATPVPEAASAPLQQNLPVIGGAAYILTGDNPVVEIAEKIGPSVVGISNRMIQTQQAYPFGRGQVPSQGQGQEVEASSGSGVIITSDGYILTNCHVVEGASSLVVTLPGGEELPATLVGLDSTSDIAVIKVDRTNLPAAPLGDSDTLRVGELAVAIGNPLGQELAGTVTAGIISAVDRKVDVDYQQYTMIQTDAAINPGNSGGALINSKGEVIGINTMKSGGVTYGGTTIEGIGFAIPINSAKAIAQELIASGSIDRPVLGIYSDIEVSSLQSIYNIPNGVLVTALVEGGAAEKAGVQDFDIITHVDGVAVENLSALRAELYKHSPGDVVTLTIYRPDVPEVKIEVRLESSSSQVQQPTPTPTPEPSTRWPTR